MRYYELTYLVSTELSEEELKAFQEKINSLIKEEGGVLLEASPPSRKKLSYLISTLNFQLSPEKLSNLEKKIKAEDQILRYLILTKKEPRAAAEIPFEISKKRAKPRPKVELKEIEKKLEEILEE